MIFFLEITNILQKSSDFWFTDFFLEILKIHGLVWIFLWIFGCFEYFLWKYIKILTKKRAVSKNMDESDKGKHPPPPPPKESHRLGPIDSTNLEPWKKPATVTRQLTKSQDFRQNYFCDFHLWQNLCVTFSPHTVDVLWSPATAKTRRNEPFSVAIPVKYAELNKQHYAT